MFKKNRVALEMTEKDYKQSTIGALEIGLLNFVSLYLIYTYLIGTQNSIQNTTYDQD